MSTPPPRSGGAPPRAQTLAYVLKGFPRLSETFITNEILQLEARGLALRLFAMRDPGEAVVHESVSRVRAPLTYLPDDFRGAWGAVLGANLRAALRAPGRYLPALLDAAMRSVRQRSSDVIKRFCQAGLLVERHLRHDPPAHLHAHFANAPTTVARYAARLLGVPFSFTGHAKDLFTEDAAHLGAKLAEAAFAVTCTRFNRAWLVERAGATPIHRIYHGVDPVRFAPSRRAAAGAPPEPPTVLSVGRFVEKKGFPVLLEALAELARRDLSFRAELIGDGPLRSRLEQRIAELSLGDRVALRPPMRQEELVARYQRARCFALACEVVADGDRDGIPNVLVEAAAVGLPLVSTRVSGIPELIEDGKSGRCVEPRDPRALADALQEVLGDADRARAFAAAARKRVETEFDLSRNAASLAELFTGTLAG